MKTQHCLRRCVPERQLVALRSACVGAAVGLAALTASAGVVMQAEAGYLQLAPTTGSVVRTEQSANGGEVLAAIGAPGRDQFGPARAEAYANEAGTFWTLATTGTIEAYNVFSTVSWTLEGTKRSAGERIRVEITGGYIELTDNGGILADRMSGALAFEMLLNGVHVIEHRPIVAGSYGSWALDYAHGARDPSITDHFVTFEKWVTGGSGDDTAYYYIDPVTLFVPLDGVAVGEAYSIRYRAASDVWGTGGETRADAFFRDPVGIGGRVTLVDAPGAAVPTPSTAWLLLAGLPLLLGARWRGIRAMPSGPHDDPARLAGQEASEPEGGGVCVPGCMAAGTAGVR